MHLGDDEFRDELRASFWSESDLHDVEIVTFRVDLPLAMRRLIVLDSTQTIAFVNL
jgi:hypothetical protein